MKKVTILALVVTLSSVMFAGLNVTWGNTYADDDGTITSASSFGVWFDVNDKTSMGWENGLKVSLVPLEGKVLGVDAGNASMRIGYDDGTSLGANYNWWNGSGSGWNTTLGSAIDFQLTDVAGSGQGNVSFTVNLGFGF